MVSQTQILLRLFRHHLSIRSLVLAMTLSLVTGIVTTSRRVAVMTRLFLVLVMMLLLSRVRVKLR